MFFHLRNSRSTKRCIYFGNHNQYLFYFYQKINKYLTNEVSQPSKNSILTDMDMVLKAERLYFIVYEDYASEVDKYRRHFIPP